MTATDTDDNAATPEEDAPRRAKSRTGTTGRAFVISLVAGVAAAAAPMGLTGHTIIDAVERFVVVALVTFIGAHARRRPWFVAGALVAAVVRDLPLALALAGLAAAVASTRYRNRAKDIGAISIGLLLLAVLWSPGHNIGWPTLPASVLAGLVLVVSGYPNLERRHRRIVRRGLVALVLVIVVCTGLAGFAVLQAIGDVTTGSTAARDALTAVRQGESDAAGGLLDKADRHLGSADSALSMFLRPAMIVPGLAQQADAVTTSVDQAQAITDAASALVETNYHDLRYEGAIDIAQVRGLQAPADRVASVLADADAEITELQGRWLVPQLAQQVDDFAVDIDDARADTDLAVEALAVAPDLLGGSGPRRYLVVFLTPAEQRGAGGFIGSWVELTAVDGAVDLSESGRIAELIEARPEGSRSLNGPDDYVERYGRLDPQDFLQDVTYSPNWPSNAQVLADLYQQTTTRPVDGVIGVDPTGLAALLELTGPVAVPNMPEKLTAENAVPLLTKYQYVLFPDRSEREDVLADATEATFRVLVDASLPAPEKLGAVLGPAARGRHFQVWTRNEAELKLLRRVHADGAVRIPDGSDGFTLVNQNLGNNKLDAFLERTVAYDVTVDGRDGSLTGTVTVTLRNTVQDLTLPDAVVSNQRGVPRGTNMATVALHAPWTVTSSTIDGKPVDLAPGREFGMNAWDTAALQIPPGGAVTIQAEISGSVDLSEGYHLRIVPQPMATPDVVDLTIHLTHGRFGTPAGDVSPLNVTANPQVLHLTGRLETVTDVVVPTSR